MRPAVNRDKREDGFSLFAGPGLEHELRKTKERMHRQERTVHAIHFTSTCRTILHVTLLNVTLLTQTIRVPPPSPPFFILLREGRDSTTRSLSTMDIFVPVYYTHTPRMHNVCLCNKNWIDFP